MSEETRAFIWHRIAPFKYEGIKGLLTVVDKLLIDTITEQLDGDLLDE